MPPHTHPILTCAPIAGTVRGSMQQGVASSMDVLGPMLLHKASDSQLQMEAPLNSTGLEGACAGLCARACVPACVHE